MQFKELFLRPIVGNYEFFRDLRGLRVKGREELQELSSYLGEESAYHHIKLVKHGPLFPESQKLVDYYGDEEHFKECKSNVAYEIYVYVVRVSEYEEVDIIY